MSHIENTQRLIEEIERLKQAVKDAFDEGHSYGLRGEYNWRISQARRDAEGR